MTDRIKQLIAKWQDIAENGEGTPVTDNFNFRCAMERCAAELEHAVAMNSEAPQKLQEKAVQPAGERELRDAIARGLVISLTPAEHDEELITAIANEVRPLLAAPTSTGESHDKPQGGQHDS